MPRFFLSVSGADTSARCSDSRKGARVMLQSKITPAEDKFNFPLVEEGAVASAFVKKEPDAQAPTAENVRMGALLQSLKTNTPYLWIFQSPVNPVLLGMPDYLDVIKTPMDFDTIEKKRVGGEYASFEAFVSDVNLTFRNAIAYNATNEVAVAARFMLEFVEGEIKKVEPKQVELEEVIDLTKIELENLFDEERSKERALLDVCKAELADARKALDEVGVFRLDFEKGCGKERKIAQKDMIYELEKMLVGALQDLGGSGTILAVSRRVLFRHKNKLTLDDDFNSDWSYNLRWAATSLRRKNVMVDNKKGSHWELKPGAVFESANAEAATEDPCVDLRRQIDCAMFAAAEERELRMQAEANLAEERGKRKKAEDDLAGERERAKAVTRLAYERLMPSP
jgi:hypothetical protein